MVGSRTTQVALVTLLLGSLQPKSGVRSPFGEVLIDTSSNRVFTRLALLDPAGISHYSFSIPNDPALIDLPIFTQGAVFGGGIELSNAVDLVPGN